MKKKCFESFCGKGGSMKTNIFVIAVLAAGISSMVFAEAAPKNPDIAKLSFNAFYSNFPGYRRAIRGRGSRLFYIGGITASDFR